MESEILHQGWLTKSPPPSKGLFPARWRRRWFVLKRSGGFHLDYYKDKNSTRLKDSINLAECEELTPTLSDRHKHSFELRTPRRVYVLAADNEEELGKWVSSLSQVCSLRQGVGEENEGVGNPNSEISSDESSPTLSSNNVLSGPYIPISECFTGKPLLKGETEYCNTMNVFQFPPKVNWATYPRKGEDAGLAPPRPPKPKPSSPRAGPVVSPFEKRPLPYHEYEQAHEMRGTYLQIECPGGKEAESPKGFVGGTGGKQPIATTPKMMMEPSGTVEYRLIDPVRTKALSKTIMDRDREREVRSNTLNRSHH